MPTDVPLWDTVDWRSPPMEVQPPPGFAGHMRWLFVWGDGEWAWRGVGELEEIVDSMRHKIVVVYESCSGSLEKVWPRKGLKTMSTELAETETEDGALHLTQFSGGAERGPMIQITGPNIHEPGRAHWLTLRPKDAAWLAARLSAWAKTRGEDGS